MIPDLARTPGTDAQGSPLFEFLAEEGCTLNGFLVLRGGAAVVETYGAPYVAETLHHTYSVTKSVLSALVGIAIADGAIDSVEQPIAELLPREARRRATPEFAAVTVRHALTMTTGLQWGEARARYSRRSNPVRQMQRGGDWIAYIVTRPITSPPGTRFDYSSGASHLLAAALQHACGTSVASFAERRLLEPLGIEEFSWTADPQGINTGGWGLHLRPRDMAKLGTLYLDEGCSEGRQVVPAAWVHESTTEHVKATPGSGLGHRLRSLTRRITGRTAPSGSVGYGYHWWLPNFGGHAALGAGGQAIYVLPDDRAVVVITAGLSRERTAVRQEVMERFVLPALRSSGSPRLGPGDPPAGRADTSARRPAAADLVSGRTYVFRRNPSGIRSVAVAFPRDGDAVMTVALHDDVHRLRVGLDGQYRHNPIDADQSLALKGSWSTERDFTLEWCWMGSGERLRVSLRFAGDRVVLDARGSIDGHSYRIAGRA